MKGSGLAVALASLAILTGAGCTPSVNPASAPATTGSAATTVPTPPPAAAEPTTSTSVLATPQPIATFQPVAAADLRWDQAADLGPVMSLGGGFLFGDTYVVYGTDADNRSTVWTSGDGVSWTGTVLADVVAACPAAEPYPEALIGGGATDGPRIVLVGIQFQVGGPGCNTTSAVAWTSTDGREWTRSKPFANGNPHAVWPVEGGWEAALWNGSGEPETLWSSPDGLTWNQSTTPVAAASTTVTLSGGGDGMRFMILQNEGNGDQGVVDDLRAGESRIRRSADGVTWQDIAWDFNAGHDTTSLGLPAQPPPAGPTPPWLVLADHGDDPQAIWISTDLETWQVAAFPIARMRDLAVTRYGFIAGGGGTGCGDGGQCDPQPAKQFLSADGIHWEPLASSLVASLVLDGPAGVLAIGVANTGSIWKLRA
ncbi:MAG: hypothetical protein QOI92_2210 [Chloroflexota bacterium]|nr:hypothetical protein [Chloroflexota bacterium]